MLCLSYIGAICLRAGENNFAPVHVGLPILMKTLLQAHRVGALARDP